MNKEILAIIPSEVKAFGNGCHISLPRKYLGKEVSIHIFKEKEFVICNTIKEVDEAFKKYNPEKVSITPSKKLMEEMEEYENSQKSKVKRLTQERFLKSHNTKATTT